MTETANDILGKRLPAKKPWVTEKILTLCDKRRELKHKKQNTALQREANQQGMRKAKETWIEEQCQDIEENLQKKQQQQSLPACERTDKLETRGNYYHPGQNREMSHRRTRCSKQMDRVVLQIVYTHNNRGSQGARCPLPSPPPPPPRHPQPHQLTTTATLSCGKKLKQQKNSRRKASRQEWTTFHSSWSRQEERL